MKRYLKNLLTALFGNNPFQMELEKAKEDYEKTAARVKKLDELYTKVQGQMGSYQNLVEILRKRLTEKDELLKRTKEEYQKRIEQYNQKISELKTEKPAKTAKSAITRKRKPKQKKDEQ